MNLDGLTFAYLLFNMISDLKTREIRPVPSVLYLLAGTGIRLAEKNMQLSEAALGAVAGVVCFLLSWGTKQALGYGDSLVIFSLGVINGMTMVLETVFLGACLATLWSIQLLIRKKAKRKDTIPFLPFLFLGYVLFFLLGRIYQ